MRYIKLTRDQKISFNGHDVTPCQKDEVIECDDILAGSILRGKDGIDVTATEAVRLAELRKAAEDDTEEAEAAEKARLEAEAAEKARLEAEAAEKARLEAEAAEAAKAATTSKKTQGSK